MGTAVLTCHICWHIDNMYIQQFWWKGFSVRFTYNSWFIPGKYHRVFVSNVNTMVFVTFHWFSNWILQHFKTPGYKGSKYVSQLNQIRTLRYPIVLNSKLWRLCVHKNFLTDMSEAHRELSQRNPPTLWV